jgi:O-antigen/teichoic acid export membrane protein
LTAQTSLKVNAAMNFAKVAAGMLFPLVTFPYVLRILGPEGTGKINFASSFVAYFTLLAALGIPLYGIREAARVRDDKPALSALVQELLAMHAIASAIALLAYLGTVALNHKVHQETLLFLIVGASIPLSVLSLDWLYQGLEKYVYTTALSLSFTALSVVALFLFVHHQGDYVVYAVISVVASLGSSVLNFWNARQVVFAERDRPWNFRRHLKPLATLYAFNFVVSLYLNLDTVMLGFLSTARSVGYYSSAMKLTKVLLSMVVSFGSVLLPRLSWYLANGKREEFDRVLRKSLGIVLLLCLPITTALMIIHREILLVFAGAQYLPASDCLVVTAPIILFIGLTNIFGIQILYPLGKERDVVVSVSVGAVVALVLNSLLIPRYAHLGAAWGTLIAECAVLAVQLVLVRRSYKIPWPWASLLKFLGATAVMVCLLFAVRWRIPETRLWLRLAIDVPVGAGLYFLVLVLSREEYLGELLTQAKAKLGRA